MVRTLDLWISVELSAELTLHRVKLPCPATTNSDVSDVTSLNNIMQRSHSFLDLVKTHKHGMVRSGGGCR